MVQAGSVEASSETEVTDAIFSLNDRLLQAAESPWFSKISRVMGQVVVSSNTVWGIPTPDGALIYVERSWHEHTAPVSIDGADRLTLSLQRPGEITENWLAHGVSYVLYPQGN